MAKFAWFKRLLTVTRKATVAVTSNRFVDKDGNQLTVAATRAFGISQDDYDATDIAQNPAQGVAITIMGIEELEIGAAVAIDAWLTSDNQGRGVTAAAGNPINAKALEGGGAAGDRIPVLIIQGNAVA